MLIIIVTAGYANAGLCFIMAATGSQRSSEMRIIQHYEVLLLMFSIIRHVNSQNILYVIVFSQVLLTTSAWIAINCSEIMPAIVTLNAFLALIGGLGYTILLLTIFAHIRLRSHALIHRKRQECKVVYCGKLTDRKYMSRKWRALRPLPIYCGRHFSLSKEAVMNYVSVLSTNVINAILLIHP